MKKIRIDVRWNNETQLHEGWIIITYDDHAVAYKVTEAKLLSEARAAVILALKEPGDE